MKTMFGFDPAAGPAVAAAATAAAARSSGISARCFELEGAEGCCFHNEKPKSL
jgi:hypothetical protein